MLDEYLAKEILYSSYYNFKRPLKLVNEQLIYEFHHLEYC